VRCSRAPRFPTTPFAETPSDAPSGRERLVSPRLVRIEREAPERLLRSEDYGDRCSEHHLRAAGATADLFAHLDHALIEHLFQGWQHNQ
jgi:hypothetical protein